MQKRVNVRRIDRFRGLDIRLRRKALSKGLIGKVMRLALKLRYWSELIGIWAGNAWDKEVLLVCSDYTLRGWPRFLRMKSIVIVHDLIDEKNYDKENNQIKRNFNSKLASVEAASGVVFVSTQTYREFVSVYGFERLEDTKVRVIGHCTRRDVLTGIKSIQGKKLEKNIKRLLYIGERGGYKCFEEFIGAAGEIRGDRQLEILVVGVEFNEREKEIIAKSGVVVKLVENVSDYELGRIYASSDALCYPSRMEGFGLPVLEAMTAGTPVICQELDCIKEFAGDYPYYWDGKSRSHLSDLIRLAISRRAGKEIQNSIWIERTIKDVSNDYMSLFHEVVS